MDEGSKKSKIKAKNIPTLCVAKEEILANCGAHNFHNCTVT